MLGIPILLGPALGPTLGGYLITFSDWPLIFYINVPIGILGILLAALLLRPSRPEIRTSFDILGFLLSATGLSALLYALSDASNDGWGSVKVLSFLIGGLLLLVAFGVVELLLVRREKQPLLDLRIFANRTFLTSTLALVFVVFGAFGGFFLFPIYLQRLRDLSAYQSGLILLVQSLGLVVASILGGRLVDRIGVRAVVIPGLLLLAFANWQFTSLSLTTSYGWFRTLLIVNAFGLGLCMQPLLVSAVSDMQQQQLAQANTLNTVMRFVATSLGVAVMATVVQNQTKFHYTHLAEQVVPNSPLGQLVVKLQMLFTIQGADMELARYTAIQVVIGQVERQAYLFAIRDAFWLTLVLTGVAIVAVLFVRSSRHPEPSSISEDGVEASQPEQVQETLVV